MAQSNTEEATPSPSERKSAGSHTGPKAISHAELAHEPTASVVTLSQATHAKTSKISAGAKISGAATVAVTPVNAALPPRGSQLLASDPIELDDSALSRAIALLKRMVAPLFDSLSAMSPGSARSVGRALGASAFTATSLAASFSAADGHAVALAVAAIACGALLAMREALRRPAHRRSTAQRHAWRVERIAPETEQTALVAFALWMGGFALWQLSPLATAAPQIETAILVGGVAGALAVLVSGRTFCWLVSEAHRRGGVRERVLVIGDIATAARAKAVLEREYPGLMQVVMSKPVLPGPAEGRDLSEIVERKGITLIVHASEAPVDSDLDHLFARYGCADADVALLDTTAWRRNQPSLIRRIDRPTLSQRIWKRAFDIAGASVLLVVLSPALIAIGAGVALSSPGGVFFRQEREGKNGKTFRIFKFRTMFADKCDPDAKVQTVEGDARVTRIGDFLRRTSLDEIPQLLNILRGDMSFIGPRPHAPGMLTDGQRSDEIVTGYSRRQLVKPGLTGLAQVSGHRGPVYEPSMLQDRVQQDFEYIERFSWWLDCEIALRTPLTILRAENAR